MQTYKLFGWPMVCVLILAAGCASIVSNSQYPVIINSQPNPVDITIVDRSGRTVHTGQTPTTVTLVAGAGYFKGQNYTVTFKKDGYAAHTAQIGRGVDGWYIAGNLFFGGPIGWFIVDPLTGAMWKLDEEVSATLTRQTSSLPRENIDIHIVVLDDVPQPLRSKMVRVN